MEKETELVDQLAGVITLMLLDKRDKFNGRALPKCTDLQVRQDITQTEVKYTIEGACGRHLGYPYLEFEFNSAIRPEQLPSIELLNDRVTRQCIACKLVEGIIIKR